MLKISRWGDIATVTLVVGESKTTFQFHEVDLFEASPFFKTAFNSKFREGSERTMTLPEDDAEAFEDFAEWLYSRKFEISPQPGKATYMGPLKLFVLANKYNVNELKDVIIEKIFTLGKQLGTRPSPTEVAYIYEHTHQGSGIRKMIADWYAWNIDLVWFECPNNQTFLRQHPDCATDFSVSLAKRFKNTVTKEYRDPFVAGMPKEYRDKESRREN